jgi:hypothetical protein
MSIWTHVAGIIRYDGLFGFGGMQEPDLNDNIPTGSEGPLDAFMWKNPNSSHLAARTAYIFGDLRDYDDEQEIIDYFKRITENQMVRNACFTIDVEYKKDRTFVFKAEMDENYTITFKGFVEVFEK